MIHNHDPGLPDELRTPIRHESHASAIHQHESMVLPGILQTPDYARSIVSSGLRIPGTGIDSCDEPKPVATYRLMAERLHEVSLNEERSRSLLADLASECYAPRGMDDRPGDLAQEELQRQR